LDDDNKLEYLEYDEADIDYDQDADKIYLPNTDEMYDIFDNSTDLKLKIIFTEKIKYNIDVE